MEHKTDATEVEEWIARTSTAKYDERLVNNKQSAERNISKSRNVTQERSNYDMTVTEAQEGA